MCFFVRTLVVAGLVMCGKLVYAQNSAPVATKFKADIRRQLFHDYVDREQKIALAADGKGDGLLLATTDDEINYLATEALTTTIDRLQRQVESDTALTHVRKVAYLRGMENMLKKFTTGFKGRRFMASSLPQALSTLR